MIPQVRTAMVFAVGRCCPWDVGRIELGVLADVGCSSLSAVAKGEGLVKGSQKE